MHHISCLRRFRLSAFALAMLCTPAAGSELEAAPACVLRPAYADGRLSLCAHGARVIDVLHAVAEVANLELVLLTIPSDTVSVTLDHEPLRHALGAILRDQSFVLQRNDPSGRHPEHGYTLWLLPHLSSAGAPAASSEVDAVLSRLQARVLYGAPTERQEAAIALGELSDERAITPLAMALSDKLAKVRRAAIGALATLGGADAARVLAAGLADHDPRIREATVNALARFDSALASALVQPARFDEIDYVRAAARDVLEQTPR